MTINKIGAAVARVAQRAGATRPGVLLIGWVVSPLQRRILRATGGRLSLTGRAPVLLLTTIGRRSGQPRTVPLLYVRDGERLVVCNVNPGFEHANPWTLNLRADGHARVEVGREEFAVKAHEASETEVARYWPQLTRMWPGYRNFYDQGGRRSVFVLQPDDPPDVVSHTAGPR